MARINVDDLTYCRMQVPDLDRAEQFLTDFGLVAVASGDRRRFFRGTAASAYCYILEEGPSRFLGFAFAARSLDDLDRLAAQHGVRRDAVDGPGGGWRVRLKEPNGYDVDIVFGSAPSDAIHLPRQAVNTGAQPLARAGELYRLSGGATPLKRLAHVVMGTPIIEESARWYGDVLGLLKSDEMVAGPQQDLIGSFLRINAGDDYVDHLAIFLVRSDVAGLQHLSFEAQDMDAVFADHHHLKELGRYEHSWGIGRHELGSQVFDYWADPFGYLHEHFSDSDRLNASAEHTVWDVGVARPAQWGGPPPPSFLSNILP